MENQLLTREYALAVIGVKASYPTYSITVYSSGIYSNCSCFASTNCVLDARFYRASGSDFDEVFTIPGIHIGCYVSEALLQSTLECFYNQTCVDTVKLLLNYTTDFNVTALNSTIPSQFDTYTLISDLLKYTMVDEWKMECFILRLF